MRKFGFLLLFCLCAVPAAMADDDLKEVTLIPLWIPQAQFAGYMVAQEKGFYEAGGLKVTLLRGGPDKRPVEMLKAGTATFGIVWLSGAIEERSAGALLVNLAQVIQRSALIIVADRRRGITTLGDLRNKRVGLWGGDLNIPPRVFFEKNNIPVRIIPNYTTVNLFLKGGVDAIAAMWYNEYHLMLNSGLNRDELTLFFLKDEGVNFPEDGIYCLQSTYHADPVMCDAFARASLQGWSYAFANRDEALDIVMSYAREGNRETNRAHQRWMLDRMEDLILPGKKGDDLGKLDPITYDDMGKMLLDYGMVERVPRFNDFYRGPK
ncbi:MAG: ABC transporter substrate-binding protein [Deltaproteobacteria bacterium]|nr:ABC transporter substrate-binding protein [Deltaproteobacteria bacterium]